MQLYKIFIFFFNFQETHVSRANQNSHSEHHLPFYMMMKKWKCNCFMSITFSHTHKKKKKKKKLLMKKSLGYSRFLSWTYLYLKLLTHHNLTAFPRLPSFLSPRFLPFLTLSPLSLIPITLFMSDRRFSPAFTKIGKCKERERLRGRISNVRILRDRDGRRGSFFPQHPPT